MSDSVTQHYDALIKKVERMTDDQQFEEALGCLDEAIEAHKSSSELPWLRCTVTALRATVLCMAGRYNESLGAWQDRAFMGLRSSSDAYEVALGRSTCYIKMGRPREAIKILEITLDRADPSHLTAIRSLIEKLGEAYWATHRPLPEQWRRAAVHVNASVTSNTTKRVRPMTLRSLARRVSKTRRPS